MSIANNCLVNYKLSDEDAEKINARRILYRYIARDPKMNLTGIQLYEGNTATEGDILPMIITGIHDNNLVNGQVFLDGNDTLWVTSIPQGDNNGNWNYFMCD